MKKRTKRYDEGGETYADTKSDVLRAITGNKYLTAEPSDTDASSASASDDNTADNRAILSAMAKSAAGERPSYDYKVESAATAPAKKAVAKPKATPAPASTVSSSEEGMRNYVPRKPQYRQVTQRELAESYVKKRRAAQDEGMKKGGSVQSSASRRADGIASRGKTRGKMC